MPDLDLDRLPAVPDAIHDRLWTALDWSLWGHGVGDVLREHAADVMTTALPSDVRQQLLELFAAWRDRRGALPSQPYEELRQELATAETQRNFAQVDADRHLRNARYLGGLLEQFARTLGANPLDLEELPALVDGLRTTTDQLRIKAADHAHALDRAEAGATLWKTRLVRESTQLRDHLAKARLTTARAEARAGAYCLAYDHLDAVTRTLVATLGRYFAGPGVPAYLTSAVDVIKDALSRDMESYLAEPYDDITAETRIDLTPAGQAATLMAGIAEQIQALAKKWTPALQDLAAVASQPVELAKGGIIQASDRPIMVSKQTPAPCQPGCGIGYHLQGCPHIGTQLGIAPDGGYLAKGGIIREPIPLTMVSEAAATTCRCTWLGIGTPEHPPTSLCLTPEQDQANRDRFATSNGHCWCAWQSGAEHHRNDLFCVDAAVASVPRVARESGRLAAQGEVAHATDAVLCDVADEREAQDDRLGELNYRDGTSRLLAGMADDARRDAQHTAAQNRLTWLDVLAEQFWAAMAEEDPEVLRGRLVQVAAWAVAWAEAIDRRAAEAAGEDLMTPGMPNPCQPIGYDNGHHLPGCTYADVDEVADHA